MRIELLNNFYIEYKPRCCTLMERYQGKTKDGMPKDAVRKHGHFGELSGALMEFLKLNALNGAQAVEIWQIGKMVEESNKRAVQALEKVWRGIEK